MGKDLDPLYSSALIFGLISLVLYLLVIRPLLPGNFGARRGGNNPARQVNAVGGQSDGPSTPSKPRSKCERVPVHVAPSSERIANEGGFNLLVDGMVAFRHTKAAIQEQTLNASEQASNRKERARILSRMLEGTSLVSPPAKGNTIVISIPVNDVGCPKLRRVLYLLGTYYSILVILAVDDSFQEKDRMEKIKKLRGDDNSSTRLSADVLPDHRIVVASTIAGRVAFARQLHRIDLVVDFDSEVTNSLSRFGHRVVVYGENATGEKGTSKLGNCLLC